MMSILSGNLAEGEVEKVDAEPPKPLVEESQQIVHVEVGPTCERPIHKETKVNVFLKFTFTMDQLILNLYTGDDSEVSLLCKSRIGNKFFFLYELNKIFQRLL